MTTIKITTAPRCLLASGLLVATLPSLTGCIGVDATEQRGDAVALAAPRVVDADALELLQADPTGTSVDWRTSVPLDLDTAIGVAMSRDAEVRRALAEVDRVQALLAQADRAPNPVVQLALGVPIDGLSGAPGMGMLVQQLTWLWTRPHRLDAAEAHLQESILAAGQAIVELDADVRRRHATAAIATERAGLDRAYADSVSGFASIVEALFEVGEASRIDLDRTRVETSEAEVAARSSEIAARLARIELLGAMGLPRIDSRFDVVGRHREPALEEAPAESLVVELAATARLDVAGAGMKVLETEALKGLAGTKRLPEVGASLGWNRSFMDREAVLPGFTASVPILDDGTPAIAIADAELRRAVLQLLETRRTAIASARAARETLEQALVRHAGYADTVLGPARNAERLSTEAYEEGVVDLTVVLLAQRRRIEAERRTLQFRLDEALAFVDLEVAVGGSLELAPEPPVVPSTNDRLARRDDSTGDRR